MIGSLRRTLYAAGALLLALIYAFARGRRSARRETALEAAERYAKTRKDMDDAEAAMGDDPNSARRWLSERAKSGRGL